MKHIYVVTYDILVESDNMDDLELTLNNVLNRSSVIDYTIKTKRW